MYVVLSGDIFTAKDYGYYFELKDWSEPGKSTDILFIIIMVLVSIAVLGFIGLVIFCYVRRHYKYKQMIKVDDDDDE